MSTCVFVIRKGQSVCPTPFLTARTALTPHTHSMYLDPGSVQGPLLPPASRPTSQILRLSAFELGFEARAYYESVGSGWRRVEGEEGEPSLGKTWGGDVSNGAEGRERQWKGRGRKDVFILSPANFCFVDREDPSIERE